MRNLKNFYIGGAWVTPSSTRKLPVLNPATEKQIGTVSLADNKDINAAVEAAKHAFETDFETPKSVRLERLERLASTTEARLEDLAQAMMLEMGAPISMARAAQADAAIGHLKGFINFQNYDVQAKYGHLGQKNLSKFGFGLFSSLGMAIFCL